jgi:hypothetical protein
VGELVCLNESLWNSLGLNGSSMSMVWEDSLQRARMESHTWFRSVTSIVRTRSGWQLITGQENTAISKGNDKVALLVDVGHASNRGILVQDGLRPSIGAGVPRGL